jgi:acyl carrier protein
MGMDIVEMIMEIEEEFGIQIPDRDAERIRTLGDLHQYLLRWRGAVAEGACLSSATFYRARRALCGLLGRERRSIAPCTPLEELLPASGRRRFWWHFQNAMAPFTIPELRRPTWLSVALGACYAAWFVAWLGVCLVGLLHSHPTLAITAGFAGGLALVFLAYLATRPLAVCAPLRCGTVGGLVRFVTGNRDRANAALRSRSEQEIWRRMCEIVSEHTGVDIARLKPETRFVDDLGV